MSLDVVLSIECSAWRLLIGQMDFVAHFTFMLWTWWLPWQTLHYFHGWETHHCLFDHLPMICYNSFYIIDKCTAATGRQMCCHRTLYRQCGQKSLKAFNVCPRWENIYIYIIYIYIYIYIFIFIYLFIYCHLYSAFSIVQCSNALYRLWDGEIQGHTGQPSVREFDAHTVQFNEQPLLAEASTILDRSLSHTYAHSAIMVSM